MAEPVTSDSEYTLRAYSHDVNATANLLAAHNFTTQAEEAYRLASQIWPANAEPVEGLAQVLAQAGHADQARAVLDTFASKYPDQRTAIQQSAAGALWTTPVVRRIPEGGGQKAEGGGEHRTSNVERRTPRGS